MVKIGLVGVGAISGIYLKNIKEMFKEIEVIAVYDLFPEKAEKAMEEYGVRKKYDSMEALFADEEIDIILNLTRPNEHYKVTKAALLAGKHVYSEKPLASTLEEGKELLELAKEKGLMLGGAPDTFLGAGIQTCRKLIEDGFIGDLIGGAAFLICRGHERWHPNPEFYYKVGGGPMMDMGPYYLTAMVNLLGRVKGLTGTARTSFSQRVITSEPKAGTMIDVEVPTMISGTMDFENGALGTIFTTFDVHYEKQSQARFEIYGSKGTLLVPDPNTFGGPIYLLRQEEKEFKEMPLLFSYETNSRGLGIADMAKAIETGRSARADGMQTLHVLEIMTAFEKSSKEGKYITLDTPYEKKPAMGYHPIKGIIL